MIRNVRIETLEQLTPLLTEQEYRPDLLRNRSPYLYRGMANSSFRMVTSLRRNCKDLQQRLEPAILKNFAKYAEAEDPEISHSIWRQMILGQHHGLPTRLLDWSRSALVALHFAVSEDNLALMDAHDCMVWRIDIKEVHALLPQAYRETLEKAQAEVFTVELLRQVTDSLSEYDRDMGGHAMALLEPPSLGSRIITQYAHFAVVPTGMDNVETFLEENTSNTVKYVIDRKLRWRVRDMLDELNMSERIVYPGLDGLSAWIGRHYYVKDRPEGQV